MKLGFLKFFKAEQTDDTRSYPVEDGRLYREGITTLIKHKSKEKTTCGEPKNIATTMALFFQNATRCVRIFAPRPLDEVYNDKDMLVEANIFLRRGGRIQFLHTPAENKFIDLLKSLDQEGLIQAEEKSLPEATRDANDMAFATMDEEALRCLHKDKTSYFCANDPDNAQALIKAFMTIWARASQPT